MIVSLRRSSIGVSPPDYDLTIKILGVDAVLVLDVDKDVVDSGHDVDFNLYADIESPSGISGNCKRSDSWVLLEVVTIDPDCESVLVELLKSLQVLGVRVGNGWNGTEVNLPVAELCREIGAEHRQRVCEAGKDR